MNVTQLNVNSGELRTVRLYGVLGARFGRVHHLAVSSAAEAVKALGTQLRGFDAFLTQSKDNGLGYAVFYGKNNLTREELQLPSAGDIRIAPILLGSKNGGVFNIILGAVLVVVGTWLTTTGIGATVGPMMVKMGWGLIIGGVVQLLTPVPKGSSAQDRPENQPSYAFNGPLNTQAQGNPVPVLYGELIIGSAVLSAGITAKDQAFVPSGVPGHGSGGSGGGGSSPFFQEHA